MSKINCLFQNYFLMYNFLFILFVLKYLIQFVVNFQISDFFLKHFLNFNKILVFFVIKIIAELMFHSSFLEVVR